MSEERDWRVIADDRLSLMRSMEIGYVEEVSNLKGALRRIAEQQTKTLDWMRANGIVFDNLDDHWQKVAFSIYNDLCEVDMWAHEALGETVAEEPL